MGIVVVGPDDGEKLGVGTIRWRIIEDGSHTGHRIGLVEVVVPPGPAIPPEHVHGSHDEIFIVTRGRIRFTSGDQNIDTGVGTCVTIPPGTAHTFSNPFDEPATCITALTPDLYVEYFRDLSGLPLDENGRLNPADIARTMTRYDTQIVAPRS